MISVIIPVYNTAACLEACYRSIAAQTLPDWECILVDDGSTDTSGLLCDGFAAGDTRVKVIHQENRGVSAARNRGLELACGEYIAFVDSDDWIERHTIEQCLYYSNKYNADIICFRFTTRLLVKKSISALSMKGV